MVIISSSGMMTGGRILHHLKQRLPEGRNTVIVGGFQAEGTRGRSLQEGAKWIRIHGKDVPIRATIEEVPGLSGHADRSALLRWLEPLKNTRAVFLVHGEPPSAEALAQTLRKERDWSVHLPTLGESHELT
jgi:metallo-beta-lactamase family protein